MSIGGGGDDEEELEAIQRMQDDKLIMRTPTTTIAVMLYPTNQVSILALNLCCILKHPQR